MNSGSERDGRLYLTINRGSYIDARGTYNVRIRKELDLSAMARTADDRNETFDPFGIPATQVQGRRVRASPVVFLILTGIDVIGRSKESLRSRVTRPAE